MTASMPRKPAKASTPRPLEHWEALSRAERAVYADSLTATALTIAQAERQIVTLEWTSTLGNYHRPGGYVGEVRVLILGQWVSHTDLWWCFDTCPNELWSRRLKEVTPAGKNRRLAQTLLRDSGYLRGNLPDGLIDALRWLVNTSFVQ